MQLDSEEFNNPMLLRNAAVLDIICSPPLIYRQRPLGVEDTNCNYLFSFICLIHSRQQDSLHFSRTTKKIFSWILKCVVYQDLPGVELNSWVNLCYHLKLRAWLKEKNFCRVKLVKCGFEHDKMEAFLSKYVEKESEKNIFYWIFMGQRKFSQLSLKLVFWKHYIVA